METPEIIDLAVKVLTTISDDLRPKYEQNGRRLELKWSSVPAINAKATLYPKQEEPDIHEITINYALVDALYNDITNIFTFIESDKNRHLLKIEDETESLKYFFGDSSYEALKINAFISAITWVFFHELGHLSQGHSDLSTSDVFSNFNESYALSDKKLTDDEASLSNCLELAADYFATVFVAHELLWHFQKQPDEFEKSFATLSIGISCAIYRFTNKDFERISPKPKGSHPPAIVRLDFLLPHMIEIFNHMDILPNYDKYKYTDLALNCSLHSYICAHIRWHNEANNEGYLLEFNENLTPSPLHMRENGAEYLRNIISVLDKIREKLIHNMGIEHADYYVLNISDEYRNLVSSTEDAPIYS